MGCGKLYTQLREIDQAISGLVRTASPELADTLATIRNLKTKVALHPSTQLPRTILQLIKLLGLSPGSISLFLDVEGGFLTAAKVDDKARPVYHYVSADVAARLLTGGLDHDLEDILMTPDDYIGE